MKIKIKHPWELSYKEAVSLQNRLKKRLTLKDRLPKKIGTIAGADVSYSQKTYNLYASVLVFDFSSLEIIEAASIKGKAKFPYIPGLLSFRESPIVLKALKKLKIIPDIIMFDGQGIAHPRGFGIASHVGVLLGIPTIGCAKSRLYGTYKEPKKTKGSWSSLYNDKGFIIGSVLRTKENVKPLFISPGNMISIESARKITLRFANKYRIPLPTRQAHIQSNLLRAKETHR